MKFLLVVASLTMSAGAGAASLDLSRVPPSLNASVAPNILISLDDSGSMAWGHMPSPTQTSPGTNCNWYNPASNTMYFNPALDYSPPLRADGTQYPNARFVAAWVDGLNTGYGTVNLSTNYRVTNAQNTNYTGGWKTDNFPSGVRHNGNERAFYCVGNSAPGDVRIVAEQSAAVQQNFANWFSYYRFRSLAARSALSTAFANMDQSVRVAWQNFNSNQLPASTEIKPMVRRLANGSDDITWRTTFYTWLNAPRYDGGTPMRVAFDRAGQFYQRSSTNERNPYWDAGYGRELSCRQNFHVMMTDGYWNGGAPTGRGEFDQSGRELADGRILQGDAAQVYFNQTTRNNAVPNLADLAMYYYARDLRTNLENNVPGFIGDRSTGVVTGASAEDEIYFNPANDPADWQRMVNFMVTFGAGSSLTNDPATLRRLRRGEIPWPAAVADTSTAIDDAWHAAVNSRGSFLSANNPQELVNALSSIMDNISRRQGVVGSAGSTSFLRSDAVLYEASYDTGRWGGDIIAREINSSTGEPTDVMVWANSAGEQLNARSYTGRRIITNTGVSGAATQVNFAWGSLSAAQRAHLNLNPSTNVNDGLGEDRANWIRGNRAREQQNGGPLRSRDMVLGPIINSSLIRVAAPRFGYRGRIGFEEGGSAYENFRQSNQHRPATLYVGANDGMLHAFDASNGHERWAFVPNRVVRNLARLTVSDYQFLPFVNNTPIDHDVFINGAWRTVLIGTLGLGGQGVYAIDITDPESPNVLWEFTDEGHAHLGYTYGRANVYRLSDGTWVALVPSGYNSEAQIDYATRGLPNERSDNHVVTGGDSDGMVFVIRISDGQTVGIPVSGARGLATVQLADYELDYELDFAITGDLNGNLFRIDFKDLGWGSLGSARVDRMFSGSENRPITSGSSLFADPTSGEMMVVIGTGKYLEDDDRDTEIPRQAIYGIRECGPGCGAYPITLGDLVEQTVTVNAGGRISMDQTRVIPADKRGWYIQLGNPAAAGGLVDGERVIDMSLPVSFANNIVAIGSYIPSDEPCSPQGTGAVYVLSALTGGFAFPGGLNAGGNHDPGDGAFIDDPADTVGRIHDGPPDLTSFIDPGSGVMSVMGSRINGVPIRRRSGWREIPVQ